MCTISIEKQNVVNAFNNADSKGKKLLTDIFGENYFTPPNIKDRVKTFEDACKVLGIASTLFCGQESKDEMAYKKLKIIVEALNEGWKPDWQDVGQYKYFPWFKMSSGSGLAYDGYADWDADSFVGSRLCFKSRELAEYAGKQFINLYNDFMTI